MTSHKQTPTRILDASICDSPGSSGNNVAVTTKISQLNQALQGKLSTLEHRRLASRDGLLDSLFTLFDECNNENLRKNSYVAKFVNKYAKTIQTLKTLRLSMRDFKVKNIIGRGHFGEVQVVREKGTGDVYALKVLRKTDTLAQESVTFYEEERDIMARSCSPWITSLHYAFHDKNNLYLVMDFHPGGDLLSLLGRYDDMFDETMARFYLGEMTLAVHALHSMGYVHRDVKPENILIDRTGHVKLADFGSACRLNNDNSVVSNMPVGTPDYICPELLMKMNSSDNQGRFGEECDWWSLGICAYEMLYGKTPFTDENSSMVVTYANIMGFKKKLKFPSEPVVSAPAQSLIKQLLTDKDERLRYQHICTHPFFDELNLDTIRQSTPPFLPNVSSNDDTSNFDDFERINPPPDPEALQKRTDFSGRDLPFIGFTFTKSYDAERVSVSDSTSGTALERRLTLKSRELQDVRGNYKDTEYKLKMATTELQLLKTRVDDKDKIINDSDDDRDRLAREIARYKAEIKGITRRLTHTEEDRRNAESRYIELQREIEKMKSSIIPDMELDNCQGLLDELMEENSMLRKDINKVEKEMNIYRAQWEVAQRKLSSMGGKLSRAQEAEQDEEVSHREIILQLQDKINKEEQRSQEAVTLVTNLRDSKAALERKVLDLQLQLDRMDTLKSKLTTSEEKRRDLEVEIGKLQGVQQREQGLRQSLQDKAAQRQQAADRLAETEEILADREREFKKCEKLYSHRELQLKKRIMDLENELEETRAERKYIEESSIIVFEENEERLRTCQEQETTITLLKGNIQMLEDQMTSLRCDIESDMRRHSPTRQVSRRSGFCQTDVPLMKRRRRSGLMQNDCTDLLNESVQTSFIMSDSMTSPMCLNTQEHFTASPHVSEHVTLGRKREMVSEGCSPIAEEQESEKHVQHQSMGCSPVRFSDEEVTPPKRVARHRNKSPVKFVSHCQVELMKDDELSEVPFIDEDGSESSDDCCSTSEGEDFSMSVKLTTSPGKVEVSCLSKFADREPEQEGKPPGKEPSRTTRMFQAPSNRKCQCDKCQKKAAKTEQKATEENTEQTPEGTRHMNKRLLCERLEEADREKAYLQLRVDTLQKELDDSRDSTYKQRIRALDLKHDMREKTENLEKELISLKAQFSTAELALEESRTNSEQLQEKETSLRTKYSRVQTDLDTARLEARKNNRELTESRDELQAKVASLERSNQHLEKAEKESSNCLTHLEKEVRDSKIRLAELTPKCQDLESQHKKAMEEKSRYRMEADRLRDQLSEKTREIDLLNQKVARLKALVAEQESQLEAFEALSEHHETKHSEWSSHRKTYEEAVGEREEELEEMHRELRHQNKIREKAEDDRSKLETKLNSCCTAYAADVDRLQRQITDQQSRCQKLNAQLGTAEQELSLLQVQHQSTRRHLAAKAEDTVLLKEEISRMITLNSELKTSNLKYSKQLEDAIDQYEILESQKMDLENYLENILSLMNQERYKSESTVGQQTKLIEYLQEKVENPPKKKKGLFGGSKKDAPSGVSIHLRELQHRLEGERGKSSTLRNEISRLRDELNTARTETTYLKSQSVPNIKAAVETSVTHHKSVSSRGLTPKHATTPSRGATPSRGGVTPSRGGVTPSRGLTPCGPHPALSMLALSPSTQPSPGSTRYRSMESLPTTPHSAVSRRANPQRMHHNIPHRFTTGLNSRATTCAVCLGSIHFVKQAAKCGDCGAVCHPRCVPNLPATCGLPTEYARHFTDMMSQARLKSSSKLSVANLRFQMQGWMKLPSVGKQIWERRWIELKDNTLYLFENNAEDGRHIDEFDLCPKNGEVSVHSAVSVAELTSTASVDLPYILRLEFEPNTTCWPGRSLYMMALTFTDKQKWVATFEAIANHSGKEDRLKAAKVLGNTILKVSNNRPMENINCTLALSDQKLLVGTEEGLYCMEFRGTPESRPIHHLPGLRSVQSMVLIKRLGLLVIVAGRERDMVVVTVNAVHQCVAQSGGPSLTILQSNAVTDATAVTTLAYRDMKNGVYMCVAAADKLLIMKYNEKIENFAIVKEWETQQPCSCMYFGDQSVLLGSDKFYSLSLNNYSLNDFLDESDPALAYAVFGTAHYNSFPIHILQVAPSSEPEEFLLCFHEFGVFVDIHGRKSREKDMKWSGMPLAFAYQAPYLYMVHFSAVQVVEILPRHFEEVHGGRTFLNLLNPRYLGCAIMDGAVYLATSHNHTTQIVCYKGNISFTDSESDTGKENFAAVSSRTRTLKSPSKRNITKQTSASRYASPPVIHQMSSSPSDRRVAPPEANITLSSISSASINSNLTPHRVPSKSRPKNPGSARVARPPHQHTPHQHTPHQHTPHQHTPHQHTPHQHTPHQHTPHQHTPHQHTPHQHTPHQHTPHQHTPHQHTPQRSTPRANHDSSF